LFSAYQLYVWYYSNTLSQCCLYWSIILRPL
jgi:hypothetical protein